MRIITAMSDFEKLGAFYLGRGYDAGKDQLAAEPLMYDSRDLTTHAVCVGMTGSGKTGLCVSLLEEAAIDGVPAIAIDPNDAFAFTSLSIFLQRMGKIPEAETAAAKARMISWKEELKKNPNAPPPVKSMTVQQLHDHVIAGTIDVIDARNAPTVCPPGTIASFWPSARFRARPASSR